MLFALLIFRFNSDEIFHQAGEKFGENLNLNVEV